MYPLKDFDRWNILKKDINYNKRSSGFYLNEREVWYVYMWINIWYEQSWKWKTYKRPVLVLRKLWNIFLCLPMTTGWKDWSRFYYKLDYSYFNKDSYIIKTQPRVLDKERFILHMATISKRDFEEIKKELKTLWFD